MSKIKLAIGIPNTGGIKAQTAFCLIRALKSFPHDYDVIFKEGSILHINREAIVKKALELECTHLLFLDSDMYFEADAITRLLDRKKDIVGANYHLRAIPPVATIKISDDKWQKVKHDDLVSVDSVATGFMLINLNVFKKLKHPWFFWKSDKEGELLMGEDYWFCQKAQKAGYKIWGRFNPRH